MLTKHANCNDLCITRFRKATKLTVFGLIVAAIILALILYFSIGTSGSNVHDDLSDLEKWTYPEERRARGAIASNGGPCASVGM